MDKVNSEPGRTKWLKWSKIASNLCEGINSHGDLELNPGIVMERCQTQSRDPKDFSIEKFGKFTGAAKDMKRKIIVNLRNARKEQEILY